MTGCRSLGCSCCRDAAGAQTSPSWTLNRRRAGIGKTALLDGADARYGLSLMHAIIGGPPRRLALFASLFRDAVDELGFSEQPVGVHCPGRTAAADEQARDESWPFSADRVGRVGKERGSSAPTRATFDREAGTDGAYHVGSPETVARTIAATLAGLEATRFDLEHGER